MVHIKQMINPFKFALKDPAESPNANKNHKVESDSKTSRSVAKCESKVV